ncbi:hypothetical protein JCM33374_g4530 [Metschnikowia sp. JCM 33374]|nr:hypothetical protein JCM33374_g4530 [Metschnikowia sp. JCM 33374]
MAIGKGNGNKKAGKAGKSAKAAKAPKSGKANSQSWKRAAKKPEKTPTLKQRYARQNKIITADQVSWKPVDIPDNLGDYSGFFGLEELDGVDVRMVNGKPEFIAKDGDDGEVEVELTKKGKKNKGEAGKDAKTDNSKDKNSQDKNSQDKNGKNKNGKNKSENASSENGPGEASQDDGALTEEPSNAQNDISDNASEGELEDEFTGFDDEDTDAAPEQKAAQHGDLTANAFTGLHMALPDENDIDLPRWSKLPLCSYTLSALQSHKFLEPTPIQRETIPLALDGRDVIGKATTGSGKTLAYGIPILEKYISKLDAATDARKNGTVVPPSGVIFAPTRELAHQVVHHMNEIAKFSPLAQNGIVSITGGLSVQKQERLLSYGPGVIVATPGRFLELIEKNEHLLRRMAATDIVVLDEADRLLQDGHFEEFEKILELMEKFRSKKDNGWRWQTLVFSATFSREFFGKLDRTAHKKKPKPDSANANANATGLIGNDEILELLKKKLKFKDPRPALCDANPKEIVSGQVTEALVECGATERDLYIYYFVLTYPGSTLVFANSVESVRRLVPLLENLNVPAFSIHSAMMQKQRLRALERFKASCAKNKSSVLIATDVAARGLDIPNIDHVAHYHLPRSADVYVHRSGRTARAGKEGVSVMFCSPQEASGPLKKLRNLLAGKLGDSSISGTATRKESSWLKEAAQDLGIEDLDELDQFEDDVIKKQRQRKERKMLTKDQSKELRYRLKQLLATPLRSNHRRSYITSGLENLAHQIVSGNTSDTILGKKSVKALDELRGSRNRVSKPGQ